jgi:hypothetical protein
MLLLWSVVGALFLGSGLAKSPVRIQHTKCSIWILNGKTTLAKKGTQVKRYRLKYSFCADFFRYKSHSKFYVNICNRHLSSVVISYHGD